MNISNQTGDGIVIVLFAISVILNMFHLYEHFGQTVISSVMRIGSEETIYLCPFFRGGLGNLMFQYASVYGIAKRSRMHVGLYASDEINKVFNLSKHFITNKTICQKAEIIKENRASAYDNISLAFIKSRNYKHKSYLQSWKYFSNIEKDLRKLFVFSSYVRTKAQKLIDDVIKSKYKMIPQDLTVVGVHVRRGDLLQKHNVYFGYQTAPKEYFENAMKFFRDKNKNLVFLVFTNPNRYDRKWVWDNIKGNDVIKIQKENSREIDMCALSMCNHTIISVGSFGWWASWIANGTTVYYKNVARTGSKLQRDFSADMKDYFYPTWIGL